MVGVVAERKIRKETDIYQVFVCVLWGGGYKDQGRVQRAPKRLGKKTQTRQSLKSPYT